MPQLDRTDILQLLELLNASRDLVLHAGDQQGATFEALLMKLREACVACEHIEVE